MEGRSALLLIAILGKLMQHVVADQIWSDVDLDRWQQLAMERRWVSSGPYTPMDRCNMLSAQRLGRTIKAHD